MIRRRLSLLLLLLACSNQPTTPPAEQATLEVVSGDAQATTAGYQLPDTVVIRLLDEDNSPIGFAPIHASTEALLAELIQVDALTRADGTARIVWRLGLSVGPQRLSVSSGVDAEVTPIEVTAESRSHPMRALAGDEAVLCAIDLSGQLGCWNPLADADHAPRWTPHTTTERFVALAIHHLTGGERRGCAASVTGRIWCFDVSSDASVSNLVERSGTPGSVTQLSTASGELDDDPPFCALSSEGTVTCWGGNAWGTLGDGSETSRNNVVPIYGMIRFQQLAVGAYHACATAINGDGWCWGRNDQSQVGLVPSLLPISIPVRRTGTLRYAQMQPIPGHATCGVVRENGGVYCWGAKEATGIGAVAMALIDAPNFSFPVYAAGAGRGNQVGAVDDATVLLGTDGESSWWGHLDPGVAQVYADGPRPFVHQLELASLVPGHHGGLLCGMAQGSTSFLCGRMMTLTGYPSHQVHPELSGFGMPQP